MEDTEDAVYPLRQTSNRKDYPTLFTTEPAWREYWWGMPSFNAADSRPQYRITINFKTAEDIKVFAEKTNLQVNIKSDSAWFPQQERLRSGQYYYTGPKTDSKYPVCIPSKGRADSQTTGKVLDRMGVSYRFFVEETEYNDYCQYLSKAKVIKMPFHDLGQGSIPARNFIWEWAKEHRYKRHWVLDDNIKYFGRCTNNRRLQCKGGGFFNAMEDFIDRYKNIVMAGPHHIGFIPDRTPTLTPCVFNSRVYSCILLNTMLPHRWRGKYNEDTDLSLRLLKSGYCTLLFRALYMCKPDTAGGGKKAMKGGNTDTVYKSSDRRRAFAESLRIQHPDCVKVVWKFNRWHHQVDYSAFKRNKPILKSGITIIPEDNNYMMRLVSPIYSEVE